MKKIEVAYEIPVGRAMTMVSKRKVVSESNLAKVCADLEEKGARILAYSDVDGGAS